MLNSSTDAGIHASQTVSLESEECLCADLFANIYTSLLRQHRKTGKERAGPATHAPEKDSAFLPAHECGGLLPRFDEMCCEEEGTKKERSMWISQKS
ncbi:hypothetical protein KSD_00020 [Ktedonobacter sp. SOSP1-85]|nr:hypothetical protein KSD_00020 [Ktedonobacter sp. SOSP1-85]